MSNVIRMKQLLLIVVLGAFAFCQASVVRAGEPRAPTGKWVVDFNESQCLASRDYGSKEEPLVLVLKPAPIGNMIELTLIVGKRFAEPIEMPISVQVDDGPLITSRMLAINSRKDAGLIRVAVSAAALEPMKRATRLSIAARPRIEETFVLTSMPALARQMEECIADLQLYWNIEPSRNKALRSSAKGNLAKFINDADYPDIALDKGEDGIVEFALLIDEEGKVADCTLTKTSSAPVLDAQACLIMQKAKLEPAIGADGKPAKDAKSAKVKWIAK